MNDQAEPRAQMQIEVANALAGMRIVNTCSVTQAGELDALLQGAGAIPLDFPCTAIVPSVDTGKFDHALQSESFDWICLTSQNAVEMLVRRSLQLRIDRARLTAPRYAVVGTLTADALQRALGIRAAFAPGIFDPETMDNDCPLLPGERVLMPVSNIAPMEPAAFLARKGVKVVRMVVYQHAGGTGGVDVGTYLSDGMVDGITFTSPAAISGFVARLHREGDKLDDARQAPIACLGSHTCSRSISEGMLRCFRARTDTLEGLINALAEAVTARQFEGRYWG